MSPLSTKDEGTSPGWTLAEIKTTGFSNIHALQFYFGDLSGCIIGLSMYFSY